ncbi:MAG: PBP1A family penicillin-binding protein [Bryobacteraceae bacterium]|nr:PBP1A family penicillin-binding protein [Bryobacteraceae bacterium]
MAVPNKPLHKAKKPKTSTGKPGRFAKFYAKPLGKAAVLSFALLLAAGTGFVFYWLLYFNRLIDAKLAAGPYAETSRLYASPQLLQVGEETSTEELVAQLRRCGYGESRSNRMGWYNVRRDGALEVFPGVDSYFRGEDAVVKVERGKVAEIYSLRDHTARTQYWLEPELITNLFDRKREKRRIVKFNDIPPVLVNAVLSAEDKRFFSHQGFDPIRVAGSAWQDIRKGYRYAGASTLTMQLARMFWLNQEKTWKRKLQEVLVAVLLEWKLTKEEIFEHYANQIDLGRHRSFNIHGFGEGAQVYFGKDMRQLSLTEASLLAGLIQRPNYLNPYRHPERAKGRRNIVLGLMRENGFIDEREYARAAAAPVQVAAGGGESGEAPYFVDLVYDSLQDQFAEHDFQTESYKVYTTLDINLQREANEAVRLGMVEVDNLLKARRKGKPLDLEPQVALVALDPQSGEVKALVGGRNYGASQLNRALSRRQPGSSFKPFVYAAALASAVSDEPHATITPVTTLTDEPTTFYYDNRSYEPGNFKDEYHGTVTLRQAISKSLNIPTVKLAEAAGYRAVSDLARRVGLNADPTPAVALGAYDNSPVDMAGAYTVFANRGLYSKPSWIRGIRDEGGADIFQAKPARRQVLDPRVSYLMVNLLEEVMRSGTAAGARSRGFYLPAAGKTGTSRDAWFAGFTSKLICVVYVGFDDSRDIRLEGSKAALPIWTEFMKRAHQYRAYKLVRPFEAPEGVVSMDIDPVTGQLATVSCPASRAEVFIAGTQPVESCRLHGRGATQVASWEAAPQGHPVNGEAIAAASPPPALPRAARIPNSPVASAEPGIPPPAPPAEQPKKKGFFGRLKDLFK